LKRIQRYFCLKKRHENQQLSGAMFQDQWYVPQGESWAALFLKDAKLIIYGDTVPVLAF
jgi:hypothetical protein